MIIFAQCLAGFLYSSLIEYLSHRYILHGLGKKKTSFFHHHWIHHQIARKSEYRDVEYTIPFWWTSNRLKEVAGLALLVIVHMPIWFISPYAILSMIAHSVAYYLVHKYSHVYPKLGKRLFRHHYDHHMGRNQNMNFSVVTPIFDWVFNTREKT